MERFGEERGFGEGIVQEEEGRREGGKTAIGLGKINKKEN